MCTKTDSLNAFNALMSTCKKFPSSKFVATCKCHKSRCLVTWLGADYRKLAKQPTGDWVPVYMWFVLNFKIYEANRSLSTICSEKNATGPTSCPNRECAAIQGGWMTQYGQIQTLIPLLSLLRHRLHTILGMYGTCTLWDPHALMGLWV